MDKNNINQGPVPQSSTNENNKKEIDEIIQQLCNENLNSLLGFAQGLLKYQKLTGN